MGCEHLASALPVTAVTGGNYCDLSPGGVGTAAVGSCQSKITGQWRGRMDGNDSVKEV